MAGSGKFFVGGNWKCVSARSLLQLYAPWGPWGCQYLMSNRVLNGDDAVTV
uniref:Uncharacterized protein n=1 Tax=Arundo donax TaxID=35708 RepID=A0A0A9FSB2_ARUDO